MSVLVDEVCEAAEKEAREQAAFDSDDEAENEGDGADEADELAHSENLTYPVRAPLQLHEGGSVESFYEKLDQRLAAVGIDLKKLDSKTDASTPPPCFKVNGASYPEWLRFASTGKVPLRMDMPGEPNYCHDCTPEFKMQSMREGACLFPSTRFEHRKELDEKTTCGVSRSPDVPPDAYVIYQEMVVPLDALKDKLRRYADQHVMGMPVPRFDLNDVPADTRRGFTRINWGRSEETET